MRRFVGEIQTKGSGFIALYEIYSILGDQVCRVAFFVGLFGVSPPVFIADLVDVRYVVHVAADITGKFIETLPDGVEANLVADMPPR